MFNHERFTLVDGNFNNIFIGCVENNNDPKELGRVQIRILGVHTEQKRRDAEEGIPTSDLPWAFSINPLSGGSISGLGLNSLPVNGSWVVGFFIGGDHNFPAIFGSISGNIKTLADTSKGFNDPDGVYPKETGPSWNKYARGSVVDKGTLLGSEPPSSAAPVYPNNSVFETPDNGIIVEYDSTPSKERWSVFHKASKSYIEILPDGSTIQKTTGDRYEITVKNNNIYVKENEVRTIKGNLTIEVDGNVNLKGANITLKGKVNLKDSGGNAVMLDTIITKLNNHTHIETGSVTGTMTAGGTTLSPSDDSAINVLAAKG